MESKTKILIIAALLIVAVGFTVWYIRRGGTPVAPTTVGVPTPELPPSDLGTELYEKATNPVADKLPETVSPVPNPLQGVYKNPFE